MKDQPSKTKQERIPLTKENAEKLDHWMVTTEQKIPGIKLSRSKLVQWLISDKKMELSTQDIQSLKDNFFDDLSYAKWIVSEMTKSIERGEKPTLSEFLTTPKKTKPKKEIKCSEINQEAVPTGIQSKVRQISEMEVPLPENHRSLTS